MAVVTSLISLSLEAYIMIVITFPSLLLSSRYMKSCCVGDSCGTADTKSLIGNADKSGVRH